MDREAEGVLRAAVAAALGRRVTALVDVGRAPLEYDAFLAHRTVSRVQGIAVADGEHLTWSLIEKHTEGPDLASRYLLDNGGRELAAYSSGVLDDLAADVRSPRADGTRLGPDGAVTLWLEEVHHEGSRPLDAPAILRAASHLGGMSGRWLARELSEPWYFTGWIDRHSQPESRAQGLATVRRAHPDTVARLGGRLPLAEQLITGQTRVRKVLESLPQTLCHHDAVGANVFYAAGQTVLIDWESVGPGAVGADLASLLFSSGRRGDASAGMVASVVEDAVQSYADGFQGEASNIKLEDVRLGFDAAIALRWKLVVDIVAGIESGRAQRRGSLPDESPEEALEELSLLVDVLLASAGRVLD